MTETTFDEVFTLSNLTSSALKCCNGVRWKASTQSFEMDILEECVYLYRKLHNGTFKTDGFHVFTKMERGKLRIIHSVSIRERTVQKCLCDYYLLPLLRPTFIYDNGASQKGKGMSFTINRLKCHMQKFNKEYHGEGYFLKFDFSKFFENIDHTKLKQCLMPYLKDEKLRNLTFYFIDCFKGDKGLGLGSEVSQILALFYVNKLDHFIKEKLHIKYYGRYMDDGYLIHQDKEYLKYCLEEIKKICEEYKIILNPKKTQIIKFSRGINILKKYFRINENNKVIVKICKDTIKRMNRKIKVVSPEELKRIEASWKGCFAHYNNFKTYYNLQKKIKEKINASCNIEESGV